MADDQHSREADLLRRAMAGDGRALERLMEIVEPQLTAYVARHLPTDLRAQLDPPDVAQDVYVEAFRHFGDFRPDGNPDAFARWVLTIARHRLINVVAALRAAKRGGGARTLRDGSEDGGGVVRLLEQLAAQRRTPSQSAAAHEDVRRLEQCIADLPEDYRRAVTLRHLEGLAVADVARAMDRTPGAVHMLCSRGLRALRDRLADGPGDPEGADAPADGLFPDRN
ncbi:MAG TPA: sigma-70 family RNA polymerase sigma factor [Tepidisphaeraceae bacterium]|nr:sigma-70 family RNA polymerase sigma factor [Tepidisphaeraceae bacterium]